MNPLFELYRSPQAPLAPRNLCWNLYGPGLANIGRAGQPEDCPIPMPGPSQLLVRVDAVSLCLSDIKLIQQGSKHPKLSNRDLSVEPTRLGHEVSLTIMQVGENLRSTYTLGQRVAIQPDIYHDGHSTAYGYTIPGGLIRYHLVGNEIMVGDAGNYLLPVSSELGYAEVGLTEPWACVMAAYTQRRRLSPKPGGSMWLIGHSRDATTYQFSSGLEAPNLVVATDIPGHLLGLLQDTLDSRGASLLIRNGLAPSDYQQLRAVVPEGFDDIVLLDPHSARSVSSTLDLLAHRGTINFVGKRPLDGDAFIDLGRIHYDYIALLGTTGPDIAHAYGSGRNRCELRQGGTVVFVGAGGPMGQMHIQRALEMADRPSTILVTDINPSRLDILKDRFLYLAEKRGVRLVLSNSSADPLSDFVLRETHQQGADDCIVCVPSAQVMAEAGRVLNPDGMLVLFAGVPIGTFAPLDVSNVYLRHAQFTGTSGSTLADQAAVIHLTQAGEISPAKSVAAIGGMEAALDGIRALVEGRFPGKVVIFPQLTGLPLVGLPGLKDVAPQVSACLSSDGSWTRQAEAELIGAYWKP